MDPFYFALLLYVAAVVLAMVDLFVPSGGMLLILAIAAAIASILFGFRSGGTMGMIMLTLVIASIPTFAALAIKIWPKTPIGRRIILGLPNRSGKHSKSVSSPLEEFVGLVLVADSPLMPSGHVKIGHRRMNAIAESGLIEVGQRVKVIGVRERNLLVRATEEAPTTATPKPSTAPDEQTQGNLLDQPADELGLDSLD